MMFFIYFTTRCPSSLGRSPWNFATWLESEWILKCKSDNLGHFPEIWGQKCKTRGEFLQLQTLITNIYGKKSPDIQNQKDTRSRTIPPASCERSPV